MNRPTPEQTNAISVYCASKQKLKVLKTEKENKVRPLMKLEEATKQKLLEEMKEKNYNCVMLRCSETPTYLQRKKTTSSRTLTPDRIAEGIQSVPFQESDIVSKAIMQNVINEIYNGVRANCTVVKESITITTKPPPTGQKRKRNADQTSTGNYNVIDLSRDNPDLHNRFTNGLTSLKQCQETLQLQRKEYEGRMKELELTKKAKEPIVISFLKTQENQKRKLRMTHNGRGEDNITLQCRSVSLTTNQRKLGLKEFKALLEQSIAETATRDMTWKEFQPRVMKRLGQHIELYQQEGAQKVVKERVFLCTK